jgi:serine/threonine protein kinase
MASQYNPLQEVDTYITGLPDSIPQIETYFLESFMTNGTKVNAGAFGQTYISKDRTSVMKEIDLQNRYNMFPSISQAEKIATIIRELKSEIEYYDVISSLCDNVCKFLGYYYDISKKRIYILMENCGTDLFDIYAQNQIPSLEQNIYFIKQIVKALVCLHTNGFAHRDLKPENITVTPEGKILLIDFGFLTNTRDIISPRKGTPLYMSPENIGEKILSPEELMASDIYSLGVIIMFMFLKDYELLFNTFSDKEYNNSNFIKRIKMLGQTPQYRTEIPNILKNCQAHLSKVFGDSITMDSFFSNNPKKRKTAEELNDLLESPTESQRTFSLGGSKSRKKKRGARRGRRTRRMNKNKRN